MATIAIKHDKVEFSNLLVSSSHFLTTLLSADCSVGDYLVLLEYDYFNQSYSGRSLIAYINSVDPCTQKDMEHYIVIGFTFLASDLLNN